MAKKQTNPMTPTDSLPTRASLLGRVRDPHDRPGWDEFYARYRSLILRLARRAGLTESEAEDALQDTMVAVAKQMPAFQYDPAKGSFKGWLTRIVQCRVVDQFRRRSREPAVDETTLEQLASAEAPAQAAAWDEEWRQHVLQQAIARTRAQVSARQFQLFDLFVLQQAGMPDIKRLLGVNAPQVYMAKLRVGAVFRREMNATLKELDRGALH
jgi:RNA polymerase sigma factor (sigma-70 family)